MFRDAYGCIRMHTDAYGCIRKHNGCIQTPIQSPFHGFRQTHYFCMVPSQDGYHHQNRTEILCTMMCCMPRYVFSRTDSSRILRLCICRPMCMSAHVSVGPCICWPMYMSAHCLTFPSIVLHSLPLSYIPIHCLTFPSIVLHSLPLSYSPFHCLTFFRAGLRPTLFQKEYLLLSVQTVGCLLLQLDACSYNIHMD